MTTYDKQINDRIISLYAQNKDYKTISETVSKEFSLDFSKGKLSSRLREICKEENANTQFYLGYMTADLDNVVGMKSYSQSMIAGFEKALRDAKIKARKETIIFCCATFLITALVYLYI